MDFFGDFLWIFGGILAKIESVSGLLEDAWSKSGPESDAKFSKVVVCGQRRVDGPGAIALVNVNSQLLLSLLTQQAATCC